MKQTFITLAAVGSAFAATIAPAGAQDEAMAKLTVEESSEYGAYIADADGRALYMFMADTRGEGDQEAVSDCYEACAAAWPPLTVEEPPEAGGEVEADLIDTVAREDGAMQVTYHGWPLYYYIEDEGAGQTTGHDVEGFGAEWYLMSPSGEIIGHDAE